MKSVRVIEKNGLYYPQVKRLFFFWSNDYSQGFSASFRTKEFAIGRAKELAKKHETVVVWDNDTPI